MDVVLLRWPAEEERRARLEQEGVARLLLVEREAAPPSVIDAFEDWIRMPADEVDLQARVAALDRRQRVRHCAEPTLDDDGVLRARGGWAALPPVEGRITRAMLERYGAVVSRDALARAGWPEGSPGRNALDVHVLRLRRRVAPLGLAIRTVRSRGYLLEADGLPSAMRQEVEPNGSRRGHIGVTGDS